MANMKEKLDLYRQFKDAKFAGNAVTFTENKMTMSFYCLARFGGSTAES